MCASELEALPRTHHCGTFPLTGTSGSGSIGTCCGSFFGFCSDVHTCHTPASDGWSGEKNPGGLRGGVKKKNIRNVISAHMKQTCFHLTRLLRHKGKYSLRKFIKIEIKQSKVYILLLIKLAVQQPVSEIKLSSPHCIKTIIMGKAALCSQSNTTSFLLFTQP